MFISNACEKSRINYVNPCELAYLTLLHTGERLGLQEKKSPWHNGVSKNKVFWKSTTVLNLSFTVLRKTAFGDALSGKSG